MTSHPVNDGYVSLLDVMVGSSNKISNDVFLLPRQQWLVYQMPGIASYHGHILLPAMHGASIVGSKLHRVVRCRIGMRVSLKFAVPALDQETNVVLWHVCDSTPYSGAQQDFSYEE